MQITGGTVIFARSVQPAQFENKKAEVQLTFVLGDGENLDDKLDYVAGLAEAKALEMVGLRRAPKPEPASQATALTPPATGSNAAAFDGPAATKPEETEAPGKTKADLEAEMMAKLEADKKAEAPRGKKPQMPKTEPAPTPEPETEQQTIQTGEEDRKAPDDEPTGDGVMDDLMSAAGAEETPVTDAEIQDRIMKRNTIIKNPVAIRGLIGKYVAHPKTAREIPAEKRHAFLAELDKL